MYKVKVLTIGRLKEIWLKSAIEEYEKRLTGTLEISWVLAKNDSELIQLSLKESYIALDPKGKLLSSEELAKNHFGPRINFVIGGSNGLPQEILQNAKMVWSLSPLTFTHQMTRLILIEQLYRVMEIGRGSPYHK